MSEPIDLEAIERERNNFCLQCGPEGICRGCQELEINYAEALKAEVESLRERLKELESKGEEIGKTGALIAADKFEHCTRDPIFLVQQKIRDYGYDGDYAENNEWFDVDRQETIEGARAKRLDALDANCRDVPEKYTKVFYNDRWEFVTCCFTREGAEAFIKRQSHNLKETRIWVDSLYRNVEMIDVREYLKSLSVQEPKEGVEQV